MIHRAKAVVIKGNLFFFFSKKKGEKGKRLFLSANPKTPPPLQYQSISRTSVSFLRSDYKPKMQMLKKYFLLVKVIF